MIAAVRAELIKLRRPRLAFGVLGAVVVLGILATVLIFATAKDTAQVFNSGRPAAVRFSLRDLAAATGPTRGFTIGAGFGGVVILVLFTVSVASEFGAGTLRTLLLVDPHRLRVVAGKVVALAAFAAAAFLLAEIAATATAFLFAQIRGISTTHWMSGDGVRAWISAYGDTTLAGLAWGTRRRSNRRDLPDRATRARRGRRLVLPTSRTSCTPPGQGRIDGSPACCSRASGPAPVAR